jgi:hypothetical protein
MHRNTL